MSGQLFDLNRVSVLITGATGYLGKEMCLGLAEMGAKVLVNSRDLAKAQALVAELKSLGFQAEVAHFDVTIEETVRNFIDRYEGAINVIVNNAYSGNGGTIETSLQDNYVRAYEVTVTAASNLFVQCLPLLRDSVANIGYASVVNIASMYGSVSPDLNIYPSPAGSNPPFYGAAKAALIQWTKYGACEFGGEGIRFNSISPGPFPNKDLNSKAFVEMLTSKVPMKRVGNADEIKGPVIFLASAGSSFINGANMPVDGGWTAW